MKLLNLSISLTMALFITISCSSNKKDQLSKLKQQETAINDKIRDLETDMKKNNRLAKYRKV